MRVAILAWGSLVYNSMGLRLASDWAISDLELPLEFSRVSSKADMQDCLSLVIDPTNGSPCRIAFAESALTNLSCVIDEMFERERASFRSSIGYVNLKSDKVNKFAKDWCPDQCRNIGEWAIVNGFQGVVWANLKPNFEEKLSVPFSVGHARDYVLSLPEEKREKALTYIRNAPEFVNTRLRQIIV
jgi:hypothetical protein